MGLHPAPGRSRGQACIRRTRSRDLVRRPPGVSRDRARWATAGCVARAGGRGGWCAGSAAVPAEAAGRGIPALDPGAPVRGPGRSPVSRGRRPPASRSTRRTARYRDENHKPELIVAISEHVPRARRAARPRREPPARRDAGGGAARAWRLAWTGRMPRSAARHDRVAALRRRRRPTWTAIIAAAAEARSDEFAAELAAGRPPRRRRARATRGSSSRCS